MAKAAGEIEHLGNDLVPRLVDAVTGRAGRCAAAAG